MKSYPSIQKFEQANSTKSFYVFYKYDGSNLRFEWNKKSGWAKFGTRTRLFDSSDDVFGEAVSLFKENYANQIEDVLKKEYPSCQKATVFCEFFGPNSFAGVHKKEDKKELRLFDVHIYPFGLIGPKEFMKNFGCHLSFAAELIYSGTITSEYVHQIRDNKDNKLFEGVIVKTGEGHKLEMYKIKTNQYLQKLIDAYGGDWGKYWE